MTSITYTNHGQQWKIPVLPVWAIVTASLYSCTDFFPNLLLFFLSKKMYKKLSPAPHTAQFLFILFLFEIFFFFFRHFVRPIIKKNKPKPLIFHMFVCVCWIRFCGVCGWALFIGLLECCTVVFVLLYSVISNRYSFDPSCTFQREHRWSTSQ